MSPSETFDLVVTVAGAATAVLGVVLRTAPRLFAVASLVLLVLPLTSVWLSDPDPGDGTAPRLLAAAAGVLAVAGGGLVTTQILGLVDTEERARRAGEVLRGGAWIGALERLAVFATLVAGWGPGIAVVLAVKGLGRYPELRNDEDTGVAERFIIGTFTSVLWAAGCAGLAVLAR
jgi:hypothetical protein